MTNHEHDNFGVNPEQLKFEVPDGHTFDPVSYMISCRLDQPMPQHSNYESWEDLYSKDLPFLGADLLGVAVQVSYEDDLREALLECAMKVAEVLDPETTYDLARGILTRPIRAADIVKQVFWIRFGSGEFDKCRAMIDKTSICSEEDRHYINEAMR